MADPVFEPPTTPPEAVDPLDIDLAFVDRPVATVRLRYPFRLSGAVIDTISVRRLTTADLIHLAATEGDLFDAYGLMTGLAPAILRGLDADDGDAVTATAHALLPRLFFA